MHSPPQKSPVLNYSFAEKRSQTPLQKLKATRSEFNFQKGFGSAVLRY